LHRAFNSFEKTSGFIDQIYGVVFRSIRDKGILPNVRAIAFAEEWYLALRGGGLDSLPYFQRQGLHVFNRSASGAVIGTNVDHYRIMADQLRDRLAEHIQILKRHWGAAMPVTMIAVAATSGTPTPHRVRCHMPIPSRLPDPVDQR
jgi:hypothetical protein